MDGTLNDLWEEALVIDLAGFVTRLRREGFAVLKEIHGMKLKELLGWSDQVVEAYGKVFKGNKALVMDEGLLPSAKEDIRIALKLQFHQFALRRDEAAMQDLARAYIHLSRFQAIDHRDRGLLDELNRGQAPSLEGIFEEKEVLSEEEVLYLQRFGAFNAYLGRIEEEKEILRRDFAAFVSSLNA